MGYDAFMACCPWVCAYAMPMYFLCDASLICVQEKLAKIATLQASLMSPSPARPGGVGPSSAVAVPGVLQLAIVYVHVHICVCASR